MNFSDSFENIYEEVKSRRHKILEKSLNEPLDFGRDLDLTRTDSNDSVVGLESLSVQDENYELQRQLRPLFGKLGINKNPIGTHPDFRSLEESRETEKHYMCTMFVDIKGSTRLSLLYELEMVYLFKNSVITACVETVRSFDGHVHRIMGDAVMAFFGGKGKSKEDAIADAINCCITLRAYLEESIKPFMTKHHLEAEHFGFRIGCDFGDDNEILWGNFGIATVAEVSATGLPVDMASKLQGLSKKNQTMLGQGILDYIDWPSKYSSIKKIKKDGNDELVPLVIPNYKKGDGTSLNYKMRQLDYKKCMEFVALPNSLKERITKGLVKNSSAIKFRCFVGDRVENDHYISASRFLEKEIDLVFEVEASTKQGLLFPLTAKFYKTNHGEETPGEERDRELEPVIKTIKVNRISEYNRSPKILSIVTLKECTKYRGLHTMRCEIYDNKNSMVFKNTIAVLIK